MRGSSAELPCNGGAKSQLDILCLWRIFLLKKGRLAWSRLPLCGREYLLWNLSLANRFAILRSTVGGCPQCLTPRNSACCFLLPTTSLFLSRLYISCLETGPYSTRLYIIKNDSSYFRIVFFSKAWKCLAFKTSNKNCQAKHISRCSKWEWTAKMPPASFSYGLKEPNKETSDCRDA